MEFASSELAQEAIKTMDKFLWKGRKMYVKVSEDADRDEYGRIIAGPKARVDKSDITNEYRIYISNLPLDIKWQDVKDIFRNQVSLNNGIIYHKYITILNYSSVMQLVVYHSVTVNGIIATFNSLQFFTQVGDVTHAKLFTDQSGRPRGCGVLEFSSIELAKQAVQKMNRQDVRGRRITVQPLGDEERDKFGYVVNKSNTGMGEMHSLA
jgi:RNA recognition motif-containing protein